MYFVMDDTFWPGTYGCRNGSNGDMTSSDFTNAFGTNRAESLTVQLKLSRPPSIQNELGSFISSQIPSKGTVSKYA